MAKTDTQIMDEGRQIVQLANSIQFSIWSIERADELGIPGWEELKQFEIEEIKRRFEQIINTIDTDTTTIEDWGEENEDPIN